MKLKRVLVRHFLDNTKEKSIKITSNDGGKYSVAIDLKESKDWQEDFTLICKIIKNEFTFNINQRNKHVTLSFETEEEISKFLETTESNPEIKLIEIAYTNKKTKKLIIPSAGNNSVQTVVKEISKTLSDKEEIHDIAAFRFKETDTLSNKRITVLFTPKSDEKVIPSELIVDNHSYPLYLMDQKKYQFCRKERYLIKDYDSIKEKNKNPRRSNPRNSKKMLILIAHMNELSRLIFIKKT
ncbi:hypothetical protein BB558_000783 [Smittium angustum]|uniref:Uncharacterized protein n=1 Tax=Smittium angustum TaxID=133377 RepID=A0A2U1JD91_SMIAN|nr:hypothetical protein BB558_000783 [Smittium angustum]